MNRMDKKNDKAETVHNEKVTGQQDPGGFMKYSN